MVLTNTAGTTTYTSLSQRTNTYAEAEMLAYAQAVIVLGKFGLSKPMPRNKANNIKFRRPIPFAADVNPLTEGVTPSTIKMAFEDVSATLQQFGALIEITDVVNDTEEDPVLNESIKVIADMAAKTVEVITYGVLKAGTNVFFANGAVRTSVNTAIVLSKQRRVVRFLNAQKAMKITSIQDGSPDFATRPVEAAYVAFAHTDMENDIRELQGFTPLALYGSRKALCVQELGSVENVRYITSQELVAFPDAGGTFNGSGTSMVTTTGTSADVYPIIFIGKDSYGLVPLKGMGAITPVVINPDKIDKSDPLGQRGYVGYKTYFVALILNQTWLVRHESAATDVT